MKILDWIRNSWYNLFLYERDRNHYVLIAAYYTL